MNKIRIERLNVISNDLYLKCAEDIDQKNSKLHNLHYYNKTKSETVKLLSKHIYSQILSRTLQKIEL